MQVWLDGDEVAASTGIVVPAYFSAGADDETVTRLLRMTLADLPRVVAPEAVFVVTDGDARTARLAEALLPRLAGGMRLLPLPMNQGKLGAMRAGTRALLDACPASSMWPTSMATATTWRRWCRASCARPPISLPPGARPMC